MIEKIEIGPQKYIFKTTPKVSFSKNQIIEKMEKSFDFHTFETYDKNNVVRYNGKNGHIYIENVIFLELKIKILEALKEISPVEDWIIDPWVFKIPVGYKSPIPDEKLWHTHKKLILNDIVHKDKPAEYDVEYAFTYYVQIPNNLQDNEGKIGFRVGERTTYVLPNEGDLLIFPGDVLHRAEEALNSTIERLVIAGQLSAVQTKKHEKSLI